MNNEIVKQELTENKSIVDIFKEIFPEDTDFDSEEFKEIVKNLESNVDLKKKVDNIGLFFEMIDSVIEAKKNRLQKIKSQIETLERRKEQFREFLLRLLDSYGIEEIKGNEFRIKVVQRGFRVEITDQEKLPEDFKKTTIVVKPDLEKIAKHVRETGEVPEGAVVIPSRFVTIK